MEIHVPKSAKKWEAGRLAGWVSIAVNLSLFVVKLILGIVSGSLALLADAFHTFSDIATSVIMLISVRIAHKPGDEQHPFGHERAEPIATVIMATLLGVAGFEIGKSSLLRIWNPVPLVVEDWILWAVLFTVLAKEALAQFTFYLSRKSGLNVLHADAWHHRSDALSSIVVLGALLLVRWKMPVVDGWAGLAISLLVFYTAFRIAGESVHHLMGSPPDPQLLDRVERLVLEVPEVLGVHDVIIHSYGSTQIVSMHIEVDEKLTLNRAHQISEEVAERLHREMGLYATIHVDPVMPRTPEYRRLEKLIQRFRQDHQEIQGFHDLRLFKDGEGFLARVDLVLHPDQTPEQVTPLVEQLRSFLLSRCRNLKSVQIKVEPQFSISRRSRHDVEGK
ncbi:MAG: cation transporter [Calditrichaeota bacterium]|nr:MAG: cation transporter [Calditrichota bacterium]